MAQQLFPAEDLKRISAAVKAAEHKTSGEIVPYFVERSDDYEEAVWRGGAFLAAGFLTAIAAIRLFTDYWFTIGPVEIALCAVGAMGAGMLLVFSIPALKCFLAGREIIEHRVAQRASQAFISEEVFKTRDRTGILIFLSQMERTVLVVGDSGINARVHQTEWKGIVDRIVAGIASGKPAEGLIDAIGRCGELLKRRGIRRRADDRDELSNKLRIERRRKK